MTDNAARQRRIDHLVAKVARLGEVKPIEGELIAATRRRMFERAVTIHKTTGKVTAAELLKLAMHFVQQDEADALKWRAEFIAGRDGG